MTEFGTLEDVPLRLAWEHEAHAFTPWLAAHLERLSGEIGIPLELTGREVAVDEFSADILARNPQDDSVVLIENQLERADHRHLGQILTYMAGLQAQTVIWIAADFRPAHLSAIQWLNEHTVDPMAFFAVRVKVVRIGCSPLAPLFEVLERPNEWDRRVQAVARAAGPGSEIGTFRRDFWSHFLARHPDEAAHGDATRLSYRPHHLLDGNVVVCIYVGQEEVGVFVRGRRGGESADVFAQLEPHVEHIEAALGVALGGAPQGHLLSKTYKVDSHDHANWDAMADWLHVQADLYQTELERILEPDD